MLSSNPILSMVCLSSLLGVLFLILLRPILPMNDEDLKDQGKSFLYRHHQHLGAFLILAFCGSSIFLFGLRPRAETQPPSPDDALRATPMPKAPTPPQRAIPQKRAISIQRRISHSPREFDSHWSFSGQPEGLPGYRYFEEFHGDGDRREFIQRPGDVKPIFFYRHGRSINFTLGHRGRLILLNDYPATQSCEVSIVDLETRKHHRIDRKALADYEKNVVQEADASLMEDLFFGSLATGIGLSPEDDKALLQVVSVITGAVAERIQKLQEALPERSYVVDVKDGTILKTYKTADVPKDWWESQQ